MSSFSWSFFNYFPRLLQARKGRRHPCSSRLWTGNDSWTYQSAFRTCERFALPVQGSSLLEGTFRSLGLCAFRDYSCLHYTGRWPQSQAFRKLFFTFFSIEKLHFSPDGIGHCHKRIGRSHKLLNTNDLRESGHGRISRSPWGATT